MNYLDLDIGDYHDVVKMFHSETDRGAAVLAASFVEHYLAAYLRFFMVGDADAGTLFGRFGPLSGFSQRIETAYAFGYLTATSRQDLNTVRKIRNHFAHHPMDATFDASPVRDLVENLSIPEKMEVDSSGTEIIHDRKSRYLLSISMCVVELHNSMLVRRESKKT